MIEINLQSIFGYLAGDNNFLVTIIETNNDDLEKKKSGIRGYNLVKNIVTDYNYLAPYENQAYGNFPPHVKKYLTPDYMRLGIANTIQKNMDTINISFLNSFNILIRPDIFNADIEYHKRNVLLLEECVCHKICRNFQIDKIKNTRRVKTINNELIVNLKNGKISTDLIRYVANIFEINLLIFDFSKEEIMFYWAGGHEYPYLNLFKKIYCMSYIQGNYEPLMPSNNIISEEEQRKLYIKILTAPITDNVRSYPEISLGITTILYLETWDIDNESYATILEKYYKKPIKELVGNATLKIYNNKYIRPNAQKNVLASNDKTPEIAIGTPAAHSKVITESEREENKTNAAVSASTTSVSKATAGKTTAGKATAGKATVGKATVGKAATSKATTTKIRGNTSTSTSIMPKTNQKKK